jgi:4a-hydroxytetrahydrobiopterin dehydratase
MNMDEALARVPEWSLEDGALVRRRELDSFVKAIAWVQGIALIAEELDHHPDIDIRWRTVTLRAITHEPNDAVTAKDVELAERIDQLP